MSKNKVINLTDHSIKPFAPAGATWYPIIIIATLSIAEEIKDFLRKSSYTEQPDAYPLPKREGWMPFDWLYFHTGIITEQVYWICISERVYNDPGFRLIIMEHLI